MRTYPFLSDQYGVVGELLDVFPMEKDEDTLDDEEERRSQDEDDLEFPLGDDEVWDADDGDPPDNWDDSFVDDADFNLPNDEDF